MSEQMVDNNELLQRIYEGSTDGRSQAVLAHLAEDVDWANGMDGVHGREAVRDYWRKQWR